MPRLTTTIGSAIAAAAIGFAGLGFAGVATAETTAPAHDTSIACSPDQAITVGCAAANGAQAPHAVDKTSRRR